MQALMLGASEVIARRVTRMMLGQMTAEEAFEMVAEKAIAFHEAIRTQSMDPITERVQHNLTKYRSI